MEVCLMVAIGVSEILFTVRLIDKFVGEFFSSGDSRDEQLTQKSKLLIYFLIGYGDLQKQFRGIFDNQSHQQINIEIIFQKCGFILFRGRCLNTNCIKQYIRRYIDMVRVVRGRI
eukprot:TRINITY_DN40339_c0_g1_i5.p1 TRINITY_DN40339_c0_g1~~TRINITY_DN40339_c0_g1_i5.p1  ORF type:complete len:115 (+),score=0.03 TRINITY_DN40339_c0_g1_i5:360-704(+)